VLVVCMLYIPVYFMLDLSFLSVSTQARPVVNRCGCVLPGPMYAVFGVSTQFVGRGVECDHTRVCDWVDMGAATGGRCRVSVY
jgi:hypothetical protein